MAQAWKPEFDLEYRMAGEKELSHSYSLTCKGQHTHGTLQPSVTPVPSSKLSGHQHACATHMYMQAKQSRIQSKISIITCSASPSCSYHTQVPKTAIRREDSLLPQSSVFFQYSLIEA